MFSYLKRLLNLLIDYPSKIVVSRYPNVEISDTAYIGAYRNLRLNYGGKLKIADHSLIHASIVIERVEASVLIGARTFIGASTITAANEIIIGDDVLISWGCTLIDHNAHSIAWSQRSNDVTDWREGKKNWQDVVKGKIYIHNKAWIGVNAMILKNVSIGEGAIVGAGSVVTKDVPAWTIVAGNPAKIIRLIPEDER